MSKKIAVCDDDPIIIKQMQTYLLQLEKDFKEHFEAFYFSSGEELLESIPLDVNVVFLDIELQNMNGIDVAAKLREKMDFYLIFITNNVQYALQGYEVHAFSFIKKPLSYAIIKKSLYEAIKRMDILSLPKIVMQYNGTTDIVLCKNILYIESFRHEIVFTMKNGEKRRYTCTMKELEDKLPAKSFFRCHNSYIVNMQHVTGFNSKSVYVPGGEIPLSKYKAKEFSQALLAFQGEVL